MGRWRWPHASVRPRRTGEFNRGSAAVNSPLRNDLGKCERLELQAVEGQPLNALAYGQLTGHLVRALNVLGIKRELRDVTPALHQYLDALQAPVEFPDPAATTEAAETPDSAAAADEKD